MKAALLLAVLICVISVACAASNNGPSGKKVLVVLEEQDLKSSHSTFFKNLEADGFKLDYTPADVKANFHKYGVWNYDHLILFAPQSEEFAGLDAETVLDFVDQGGNVLIAADSDASDAVKAIGSDCNIELDNSGAFVIDHHNFNTDGDDGQHTLIASDNFVNETIVVGNVKNPVLFRGVGLDILEDLPLLFPVLSGSSYSYSHDPTAAVKSVHVAGKKTTLVAALQARNNARLVFSGSLELFSNKFFTTSVSKTKGKSGNEEFARAVAQWTFHQKGSLRSANVTHHIVGQTESPRMYTIKDEIFYSIDIQEWKGDSWVPFQSEDVQLEYIMLDPYVRIPLTSEGNGTFSTQFKAPDVYGVFTFQVNFQQRGYGFINEATQVPVRPFRHTQYERFIPSAFPYYASAFSMLFGLWVFSWFFLYTKE